MTERRTLYEFFRGQYELQFSMPPRDRDFLRLSPEDRVEAIRWNVLALEDELHELLDEVGWKPWATSRHVNSSRALEELADAFHFFMNLVMLAGCYDEAGIPAHLPEIVEALERMYWHKRDKNLKRQREGYDGVSSKCPNCKRDLEESPECRPASGICVEGEYLPHG